MSSTEVARIKALVKRQSPITETFTVTPELAEFLLEMNWEGNRSVTQNTVDRYANEMRHGNWMMTGEPIIISKEGKVIDGQHRLWAVIESSCPIEIAITFGIEPNAYRNINCGRTRTLAYRAGLDNRVSGALTTLVRTAYGAPEISQSSLRVFDQVFGDAIRHIIAMQDRRLNALRRSDVVAAAAIWYCAGHSEYVTKQYSAMFALNSSELAPVCRSFLKQAVDSSTKLPVGNPTFVKAFKAFDPDNKNSSKAVYQELGFVLDRARQAILKLLAANNVSLDAAPVQRRARRKAA